MKEGVLKIIDKDSLFRSVVVAKVKAEIYFFRLKWNNLKNSNIPQAEQDLLKNLTNARDYLVYNKHDNQRKAVERLSEQINVPIKESYDLTDVKAIQRGLNEVYGKSKYRIHVFKLDKYGCSHEWSGATPSECNIILIKKENIFNVPKSIAQLLNNIYFCNDCLTTSKYKYRHRCETTCRSCGESTLICHRSTSDNYSKQCENCKVYFLSIQCYERHIRTYSSEARRCGVIKYCEACNRVYNVKNFKYEEGHVCGQSTFCLRCTRHVESSKLHPCYTRLPTVAKKKKMKNMERTVKFIVFDFECAQSVELENGKFAYLDNHEVVLAVARKACFQCFDLTRFDVNVECKNCVEREVIFSYNNSFNVLSDFTEWLFKPQHDGSYLFSHFGGRYDLLILLQEFIKKDILPEVIMKGRRIVTGKARHNNCTLNIRDSYNLIPLPLSKFKSAFGLKGDSKGEFPFLMIEPRWYHTTQKGLPDTKYYNIKDKSPENLEKFLKWYNDHNTDDYTFDFDQEILSYGRKDVEILLLGLLEYRHAMLEITGWDATVQSCTLPSFTSHVLRCDHLPERTLVNLPDAGFNFNRQQSDMAIKWLKYKIHTTGEHIQHVENGGEKRLILQDLSTFVDGFSTRSDGTEVVYEFFGCFYHACPRCFSHSETNNLLQQNFGSIYASTMARVEKIQAKYTLEYVWECDVKKELRTNKEMRNFFNNCPIKRLVLRTAMQGGRTESHATIANSDDDNKIVYLDVNSLYPTVMSREELPVGPVNQIRDNFPSVPSTVFPWKGLGHVRVLPPLNLRYPLLAVKMMNSLMFPLCYTCSLTKSTKRCSHSEEERSIIGTWTHVELNKALSLGYIILQFYEIWEFKKFSKTLFKEYIKTFYKIKIASSDWPPWVKTKEDQTACLDGYKESMGIDLKPHEIQDNPSLRYVSKLLLNTSWGKFAQNPIVKQTLFCDDDQLIELLDTKLHLVSTYRELKDNLYIVAMNGKVEEIHSSTNGNLPLAIFITSYARLTLYSMLEASNGQALYNDTDSIIAVIPRTNNPFKNMIGDGLGKLCDETAGKEIKSAVFGGPKQYALQLVDDTTGEITYTVKIRGMSLTSEASKILNYDSMKNLVEKGGKPIEIERISLKRTATGIVTVKEVKKYKTVNDKGFIISGTVYPHGYHPEEEEV